MAQQAKDTSGTAEGAPDGAVAVVPRSDLELRKSNEAIGLRVVSGRLTLLNRKVFNVLMWHAQRIQKLGQNAPIDTPSAKSYFWVPMAEVARNASYDSNDMEFLKRQITEMQDIKLLLETERQWTSERLIASVTFVNPKGLKSKGGQVWIGFAFPPEVHESVMQPETYTRLSIHYQGLLKSGTALALYESCRRYATSPGKLTASHSVDHWYGVLTGNPMPDPETPEDAVEYKYFKRDVVKKAIAEVNLVTDIKVELIEHKVGRAVAKLQFKVEFKPAEVTEDSGTIDIDTEVLAKLMEFGAAQNQAFELMGDYTLEQLRDAIAVVEQRLASPSGQKVNSKIGYLKFALKSGVKPQPKKPQLVAPAGPPAPSLLERYQSARAKMALELFREMGSEEQATTFADFVADSKTRSNTLDKALKSAQARNALSHWYAKRLWAEPSVENLSHFADKGEVRV